MISLGQDHAGLLTDLYELTMAAAYFETGKFRETATFELSIRNLPAARSFLLAAGLEQAIQYLEGLSFSGDEIDFLRKHPAFEAVNPAFFDYLAGLRFTGSLWAIPEGTPVFAEEPLLRVTAPIVEAQIVETYLLSTITYQTNVATKAARMVRAASGRGIVEFGTRRAHGPRAGVLAARASYLAGCMGTSNVLAGYALGIPIYGTAAHSWTMSFDDERESFRQFAQIYGSQAVLLIDTYDSSEGARKALSLGLPFRGVRLDSGDLLETSREVRKILDAGGRPDAVIVASSDLNEYSIEKLADANAPIDLFGVGTDLVISRDAPALGGVYKLVEVSTDGQVRPTAKFSASKISFPGRKQVYRFSKREGEYTRDVLALATESFPPGEALLTPVLENGKRIHPAPALEQIRERAAAKLSRLPERVQRLEGAESYPVEKSAGLLDLLETVRAHYVAQPAGAAGSAKA
jgi:nicotinate phosphoribosyltransferase